MSSRRRGGREANIFDNGGIITSEVTDSAIFGSIAEVDAGRQVAKPVSIFEIYPDPLQPRRAIPSPVRPYWDGRPSTTAALFNSWYHLAVEERGEEFKIEHYLLALDEAPRPEQMGPIDSAFISVLEMAANIRSNGLTNPITVANTGTSFRLETGERRWLAYHVLYTYFENEQEKWSRIPARVVDAFSVWRQASENNARANLNAISKARQLAILLMDLYQERGEKFRTFDQIVGVGECDRAFYAQVADGNVYPTPQGTVEMVMTAGGFKTASQMREHRALLNLPDEVWRIADDLNWTQGRIRQLTRQSEGKGKNLISLALQQASAEGYVVGIAEPPPSPTLPPDAPHSIDDSPFSTQTLARYNKMMRVIRAIGEGSRKVKDVDIWEIRYMREWLTEVEKIAQINMKK